MFMKFSFTKVALPLFIFHQIFLSSTPGFSQNKFLDGYIISINGDTIKGQIRYNAWDKSPVSIDFLDKGGVTKPIAAQEIEGFAIPEVDERYRSGKIRMLNISIKDEYKFAPSFVAKDSASFFLREITTGRYASLYEYNNSAGDKHYFIEKNFKLIELMNYSFYKSLNNQKYLIVYDEYKKQLPQLLNASQNFKMQIPSYDGKSLRKYVEKYNESLGVKEYTTKPHEAKSGFEIDITLGGSLDGWKQEGIDVGNKPGFTLGARVNLPRKFNNRYFRINITFMPNVTDETFKNFPGEKTTLNTIDFGFGSYIGTNDVRPFVGVDYASPGSAWRTASFSPHIGISYRRQFDLELAHFLILNTRLSDIPFINRPRISLSYHLNLNQLFRKKR